MPVVPRSPSKRPSASSAQSSNATIRAPKQKPSDSLLGSKKHVFFCITNEPIVLPVPPPSPKRPPSKAVPLSSTIRRPKSTTASGTPIPGPFLFLKRVQTGAYGEAVAVRELNDEWWQGTSPGRVMCIKMFNKAVAKMREWIPAIVQELLAYKNLACNVELEGMAYVMALEGSLQDASRLYFVMELMECDLQAVLNNGFKFSAKDNARRWICQLTLGISAIHTSGIIHRDIKPENLLLDSRGNIRITDFGSAHVEPGFGPGSGLTLRPTQGYASELTGTYAYMAPEMLANRKKPLSRRKMYGLAVDYWSLGCVVYQLLSGGVCIFDAEEELRKYKRWCETGGGTFSGELYPAFAELGDKDGSLVTGLLQLDPLQRFRASDIRHHAFFRRQDGSNDFDALLPPARERRHRTYFQTPAEDEALQHEIQNPRTFCPPKSKKHNSVAGVWGHKNLVTVSLDPPEDDNAFEHFGWVNPSGVWGQERV
ncbi:kinase-like domain-containing protein [Roridomyces roridus]|uniref:non-specific serine/threonine protein kinase n=1 Tax=Roridomyces roridus TaxID=1738132 RepID=A0AAD7BR90_9AGAR|nr:kinase-like domain-containing protein [Roridomyces roridus]